MHMGRIAAQEGPAGLIALGLLDRDLEDIGPQDLPDVETAIHARQRFRGIGDDPIGQRPDRDGEADIAGV